MFGDRSVKVTGANPWVGVFRLSVVESARSAWVRSPGDDSDKREFRELTSEEERPRCGPKSRVSPKTSESWRREISLTASSELRDMEARGEVVVRLSRDVMACSTSREARPGWINVDTGAVWWEEEIRDVRYGSKLGEIGPKWDKSGTFSD